MVFSPFRCVFQVWTGQSGRKGWWPLFRCQSWIQKQMRRCLHRACRIDWKVFHTRRCRVGGSLIVRLILVSCLCAKIGICLVRGPSTHLLVFQRRPSLRIEIVPGPCCILVWRPLWIWWMSPPFRWWAWLYFFCTCVWSLSIVLGGRHIFLVWWWEVRDWRCWRTWLGLQIPPMLEGCGCVLDVEVSWSWMCRLGIRLQVWIKIGISRRVSWLSRIVVHTWYCCRYCCRCPLGWPLYTC